ncbi:unnamed protein product, partial [Vitis vinifera]|uniref:Uncharacterized protein n=1 Tax=Vitis vinifera TaxID=29760 RepID=D7T296_VITVI
MVYSLCHSTRLRQSRGPRGQRLEGGVHAPPERPSLLPFSASFSAFCSLHFSLSLSLSNSRFVSLSSISSVFFYSWLKDFGSDTRIFEDCILIWTRESEDLKSSFIRHILLSDSFWLPHPLCIELGRCAVFRSLPLDGLLTKQQ